MHISASVLGVWRSPRIAGPAERPKLEVVKLTRMSSGLCHAEVKLSWRLKVTWDKQGTCSLFLWGLIAS